MNILPLIFSLLIIFACLCATCLKEVKSLFLIESTLEGYNHTEKAIKNALIKKTYEKIKEDPSSGTGTQKGTKKQTHFVSRREYFPPLETSKFYLRALANSQATFSKHPLYEPFAELLRILYKKNLFDKYPHIDKPEYRLIAALVKKAIAFPAAKEISHIYPDDPDLQPLYYKMLRGTNRYTKEAGIPPLTHFVSLENHDKATHLSLASPWVLEALFGAQITEEILHIEQEYWNSEHKYYAFSKQDLETLIMKEPGKASELTALQPYLNYSKQMAKRKTLAKRDTLTGIGIEKVL